MTDDYTPNFYDIIRPGCVASAAVVAPMVYDIVRPKQVIDVGCGEGHWAKAFETCGAEYVHGLDGEYVESRVIDNFTPVDLSDNWSGDFDQTFDLAVSLEVAEHLPPESAGRFIGNLVNVAPVVLFSAAAPQQGGVGHVNEMWPAYWADLFNSYSYQVSAALRWRIWNDERVENWYRQNLLFAVADDHAHLYPRLFDTPLAEPFPVIHPVLWNSRTT